MDKGLAWKFLQRRHAYNQQVYEKMLGIINHQGNAHQNHNETKQKQYPVVDVAGDRSKVQCCKEQYCIGPGMSGPRIKANWKWSEEGLSRAFPG